MESAIEYRMRKCRIQVGGDIIVTKDELEFQRYGRNKETVINHTYINSGEYRKKFDKISSDDELNRTVYQLAKKMLNHRSGTLLEDMYWIDIDTGEIIASEVNQKIERGIQYSRATKKELKKHKNILAMHTHPNSMPPSIGDFNSAYKNRYQVCLVCGHDGSLFLYNSYAHIIEFFYMDVVAKYKKLGYDEYRAQIMTINQYEKNRDIFVQEV